MATSLTFGRCGKMGGSSRVQVGSIRFVGQPGRESKQVILNGSIGLRVGSGLPIFFKQVFFFFLQLQKQINDNMFRENE